MSAYSPHDEDCLWYIELPPKNKGFFLTYNSDGFPVRKLIGNYPRRLRMYCREGVYHVWYHKQWTESKLTRERFLSGMYMTKGEALDFIRLSIKKLCKSKC